MFWDTTTNDGISTHMPTRADAVIFRSRYRAQQHNTTPPIAPPTLPTAPPTTTTTTKYTTTTTTTYNNTQPHDNTQPPLPQPHDNTQTHDSTPLTPLEQWTDLDESVLYLLPTHTIYYRTMEYTYFSTTKWGW